MQRRYLAAAALLNRLLEVTERTLGPNHVQVAGVLTNLAEMYTHLGAAREELELRERALAIRADDPNADATALERLRERVSELRAILASQEPVDEDLEMEPLPIVRTAEYTAPVLPESKPEFVRAEPSVIAGAKPEIEPAGPARVEVKTAKPIERDDAVRYSPPPAQLSAAPWTGVAALGTTPTDGTVDFAPRVGEQSLEERYGGEDPDIRPRLSASGVQMISLSESPVVSFRGAVDHGFSDMGRDELVEPRARRFAGRSGLYSIAAGVVLVAGILATRSYITTSDDERVSSGSVSLAEASAAAVVRPVSAPTPPTDPRMVERLVNEQRDRSAKPSSESSADVGTEEQPQPVVTPVRTPRLPSAAEMERALRGVDNAVKTIDQRTKAATDSASAIRVQAPTFKKTKIADP